MHQLTIDRLGPVQHCELAVRQYTVLTGFQAAGKSTVAKVIYFFRTMKDDIFQLIQQQEYSNAFTDRNMRLLWKMRNSAHCAVILRALSAANFSVRLVHPTAWISACDCAIDIMTM